MMMNLAKFALLASALITAAPLPASAAFVDHQAIRACFARAQFLLTENSGEMVAARRALMAARAAKGWRVMGDVYVAEAQPAAAFHIDCLATADGVAISLTKVDAARRSTR